ncbi:MAG: hypothetical protein HY231_04700 [Acidobacteria bacterium]|nr:hypothetical protein [Acidobacteriota bacterium]
MSKLMRIEFLLVLLLVPAFDASSLVMAADRSATTQKAAKRKARTAPRQTPHDFKQFEDRLQAAEQRALAAEQRAQQAEAAAAKAASAAHAAQTQAQQAAAALTQMQQALARFEQANTRTTQEVAAGKQVAEQLATEVNTVRASDQATAKKVEALDKRSDVGATTASKIPVKIYGGILFNSTFVDRGANNNDIPLFAQKRGTAADQNHQNFTMTARQTRLGLRYEGKIFATAKLTGVFEFDLFGGKPAIANGENFELFRLRLAYGRIDWQKNSLEAGQDWTVFAPLNPTTLASYAITGFSTSGNLWNRVPQIRYEHREGEKSKFIFTAALLDPNAGDNTGNAVARSIGLGERGALPAVESRIGFTTPAHGRESSGGASLHYSRLLGAIGNPTGTTVRSPIHSYGLGVDVNVWLSSGVRISGEAFHGRALGILSGNIMQSAVVLDGRARGITSSGGWFELHAEAPLNYQGAWKKLSANFGYGLENNRDADLLVGLRKRNQTYMLNGQYKLSPNFLIALEYRQVQTDWFKQAAANQKLNWANLAFFYSF